MNNHSEPETIAMKELTTNTEISAERSEAYSGISALVPPHEGDIRENHSNHSDHSETDSKSEPETLTISLTATGDGPPAEIRFRRALKWMLRTHGLRASWPDPAKSSGGFSAIPHKGGSR